LNVFTISAASRTSPNAIHASACAARARDLHDVFECARPVDLDRRHGQLLCVGGGLQRFRRFAGGGIVARDDEDAAQAELEHGL
jgi:hypothetical protein